MIVIGLTGSIAMGKSEVAKIFLSEGIPVFDADLEVHKLYDSLRGAELLRPLVPEAVIDDRIDRAELSKRVVANPSLLNQIESLVHHEISLRRQNFIENAAKAGHPIIVLDVPLLFEKQGDQDVDQTIVVSSPADQQRKRALLRPGMSIEKLEMILARQMPDAEKRSCATHVIENAGSLEDLKVKTLSLLQKIRGKQKP